MFGTCPGIERIEHELGRHEEESQWAKYRRAKRRVSSKRRPSHMYSQSPSAVDTRRILAFLAVAFTGDIPLSKK
jgi:hypothetical protein